MLEQEQQIEELDILEAEAAQLRAKQIAEAAQLTAKQEAENAERQRQLQAKRRQLERLETVKKLKAAKARHQVYEQNACSDEEISELLHQHVPLVVKEELKHKSSELQNHSPPQAATQQKQEDSTSALIRALAESISASRLPVPEPTTFSGDPLRLNDWKVSFRTLVDRKNIPAEENIYYLRKYVGGPAKKAIESYFLLGTESAYHAAWTILEERYGNPFLIAKAFRDKLDAWPKISSKDSVELQELSDFLRSCEAAMSQIKGLERLRKHGLILNTSQMRSLLSKAVMLACLSATTCSQALVPREVVPGEGNQPFAQGTDLGWSVVGFGNPCLDIGDMIGVSHQVTVKQVIPSLQSSNLPREVHYVCRTQIKEVSPADVVEVLESDFVERASEDNSADQASKGLTAQQLQASNGFTGPYLLWQKELPSGEVKVGEIVSSDPELKKAQVHDTQANEVKSLLDHLHKFSDWSRVVKAFARHKRLAKEIKGLKPRSCEATCLEERREAELTIIEMVQEATLSQEIKCLQQHKEYHLQQRPKWIKDRRNVKVNDVVILQDNTIPRGQWKLARVVEVYPGGDGRVRRLKLLISDSTLDVKGKRLAKPVYLERPIHKTVLLLEAD
ncbi:uncharacterized protein LOC117544663 [Gymnodraco acuticeps]|uniref:Uncharacterized protein LOC117544663 n=1 Tax=Gymnodraco acuticeps TaxID=8218 RepID=A0A6P8UWV8_GYMAC|nr:uncharacterized protein LOC117544663 [Gymnodraco acuticeps]